MEVTQQITDNIVETLLKLHNESIIPNISAEEFGKRGNAISFLLNKIENDFGIKYMLYIFNITSKKLGHTLSPVDTTIIKKLLENGYEIKNVKKGVTYKKS